MIRRILILLAALALGLSGLSASAEDAFEAGELHVYRVSMDENETVPVRWYKDTPSFPFMGIRAYYRMMFGEELKKKYKRNLRNLVTSSTFSKAIQTKCGNFGKKTKNCGTNSKRSRTQRRKKKTIHPKQSKKEKRSLRRLKMINLVSSLSATIL